MFSSQARIPLMRACTVLNRICNTLVAVTSSFPRKIPLTFLGGDRIALQYKATPLKHESPLEMMTAHPSYNLFTFWNRNCPSLLSQTSVLPYYVSKRNKYEKLPLKDLDVTLYSFQSGARECEVDTCVKYTSVIL